MAYMKQCAILMAEAAAHGLNLRLSDFVTIDGQLTIDGMPAEQWLSAMTDTAECGCGEWPCPHQD